MIENMTVQDVIQHEPVSMIILDMKTYSKCFFNENLYHVIDILKNGPKTVTEIRDLYPAKKITKTDEAVKKQKKKSENTIYRYIKELITAGVVIEAGRRIESGKVSTKILYSLAARLITVEDSSVHVWNSEKNHSLAKTMGLLLNHNFNSKLPAIDPFIRLISGHVQDRAVMRDELLKTIAELHESENSVREGSNSSNNALEAINALNAKEFYYFRVQLGNILWLLTMDLKSFNREISAVFVERPEEVTQLEPLEEKVQNDGYQDVITYKQAIIQLVGVEDWEKFLAKEKYNAITFMLREKPMTIKEIADNHLSALIKAVEQKKKEYEAKNVEFKASIPKTAYTENTIYRYVKDLVKAGFLIEAGRRIIPNQTSTQLLYARTAKAFYTLGYRAVDSEDKEVSSTSFALGQTLKHHLNKQQFDPAKVHAVLSEVERQVGETLEKSLLGATDERIADLIFSFNGYELETLMDVLGIFEWLINCEEEAVEGLRKQFLDCFKD
ncbi:MAG: hypothetical protein ACFFD4_18115 [Candidatus Odinarchaeota archaeon]